MFLNTKSLGNSTYLDYLMFLLVAVSMMRNLVVVYLNIPFHTPENGNNHQWRTQEFFSGGVGSTNSVEDRENGDLGVVAP